MIDMTRVDKAIDAARTAMGSLSTSDARAVNLMVEVISALKTEVIMYREGLVRSSRVKEYYGEKTGVPGEGG